MITPSFGLTATERVLPKLALDFTTASLDSRVTFTRTTGTSNPATYVNSSGYITAATNNQPRFDYDPVTLACKGLLIEESRSNLALYSQNFNQTSQWGNNLLTINTTATIAPDNTNTGNLLSATASPGGHYVTSTFSVISGSSYTISSFVKAGGNNYARISVSTGFTTASAWFNTSTGTLGTVNAGITATIKPAGNNWYRITATATATSTTAGRYFLTTEQVDGGTSYTGDGVSGTYYWGAQVEAGAFATSYIPTTTTALTRNADVATMTGTNFSDWFNASAGAIEMQALVKDLGSSIYPGWLAIDDGTTNNEALIIYAYVTGVTSLVRHSSANTFSLNRNGILSSTPSVVKALLSYANSDFKATYQGATPATQASGTIPSGLVQMRIGVYSSRQINGHIQKINYWPQSLQTAEVQAFTK